MRPATRLCRLGGGTGDPHAASATPIYQTATFRQADPTSFGAFDYSRTDNPTRAVLERAVAELEGGQGACAYASGMAALASVVRLVRAVGTIVAGEDLYGGTHRLLVRTAERAGVRVRFADLSEADAATAALGDGADLVLAETPSNPRQRVVDLAQLAGQVHAAGAVLAVDSTFLSPWLQNPLALGADLVIHSATKHLAGHGDVTAGVVVAGTAALHAALAADRNAEGSALAPMEAWLLLRGMKTLGVRVERQQASARRVAAFLAAHPSVERLHWVESPDHPGHAVHRRQARGPGSVIAFETGCVRRSRRLLETLELFDITVSFGSTRSSASLPWFMSHASIPEDRRDEVGLARDLVRLSIGLEDAEDLVEDLARGFDRAACAEADGLSAAGIVGASEEVSCDA